ncbi:MAG: hypothetical protein NWE88_00895 [Candidatus Bathyarchaeota archaeon]|nr:hypothetical protein [Candidatus Bathyarchaeota archaeon]
MHSFNDLKGKRTLIRGNVRTGKTRLTVRLLEEAVRLGLAEAITVIDMAPRSQEHEGGSVGGRISEYTEAYKQVRYLSPERVETPRLRADTPEELLSLVELNGENIRPLLQEYLENPTPILIVNDVSIIFQSGSDDLIMGTLDACETFIANGYHGDSLSEDLRTGVSRIERGLMDRLASWMDVVVDLR